MSTQDDWPDVRPPGLNAARLTELVREENGWAGWNPSDADIALMTAVARVVLRAAKMRAAHMLEHQEARVAKLRELSEGGP